MFGDATSGRPCPPIVDLVRFEAGELDELRAAAVNIHRRRCRECAERVQCLRQARSELFGSTPGPRSRQAAADIASVVSPPRRRLLWWRRWALALLLPAPALAAGLVLLLGPLAPTREPPSAQQQAAGIRAKGVFAISMACSRGDQVFVPGPETVLAAGDRLRFSYTTAEEGYLTIFAVEDDGDIFPYYPERDLAGMRVAPGDKVTLPSSIELDDHHGHERIFALWSPEPLNDRAIRGAVSSALAAAGGDIRRTDRLPTLARQISFPIQRQ
jgi:hypothetical protein